MQDSMCGSLIPVKKPAVPVGRTRPFDDDVPLRGSNLGGFGCAATGSGAAPPGPDAEGMVVEDYLESSSLSSWIDELLHEPPGSAASPRSFAAADAFFPVYDTPELDMADQAAGDSSSSEIGGMVGESEKKVSSSELGYDSAEMNQNLEAPLDDNAVHQLLPRTAEQPPVPLAAAREALSNLLKRISSANAGTDSFRRALESQASIPGNSHTGPKSIGLSSVDTLKSSLRRTSSASDALFSLQSQTSSSSGYQIRSDGHHNRSFVGLSHRSFTQSWPVSKVLGIARKSSASSLPLKFADTSLASGSRSGIHHFSAPAHSPPLPARSFAQSHHHSSTSASVVVPFPTLQQMQGSNHIPSSQISVSLSSVPAFASGPLSFDDSIPETTVGAFLSSPSQRKQQSQSRGRDIYDSEPFRINSHLRGVPSPAGGPGSNQRLQKSHLRQLSASESHAKTTGTRYESETKLPIPWVHGTTNSTGNTEPLQLDQADRRKDKAESQAQNGLRLVQLLLECAEAVSKHEVQLAQGMLLQLQTMVSTSGDSMQRVAACFTEALHSRLLSNGPETYAAVTARGPASSDELLGAYQILYQACPYIKFAHFTSNQAIFEAFEGEPRVHIVDLDIVQGYQWPALMQALAARRGGPPTLRLTGVGDSIESVQETGKRLSELAECLQLPFSFHAIGKRLEDLKAYMFQRESGEALAVNSVNRLHRLLTDQRTLSPLVDVLRMIYELSPKTVIVVEQEASHNGHTFLSRFLEALHYYSAIFDSLEATLPRASPERTKIEQLIFAGEITNIIACEGSDRVERHEKVERWRRLLESNGFKSTPLSSKAFDQSRILLGLYRCDGYSVVEDNGALLLGWQGLPVIAASSWYC